MEISTRNILNEIHENERFEITQEAETLLQGILQNDAEEILEEACNYSEKQDNVITQDLILKSIRNI